MRPLATFLALAAVLTSASGVRAQDESVAEALYRDGQRLIDAGKVHEACLKFAESQRLDPATGTLIATAACHEKEGKLASAWAEFRDAVGLAQHAHEPGRERYARTHAQALETNLYRVTIDLPSPPPGVEIKVDARSLGPAALGTALPLDPGHHRVEVTAPGLTSWTRDLDVPPTGGAEQLTVSFAATRAPTPPVSAGSGPARYAPAIVVGGAGVAAVVVGVVSLALADANGTSAVDAARSATNPTAYANATSQRSSALTLQDAGLVVGAAGVVATALGAVWFVKIAGSEARRPAAGATIAIAPAVFPLGLRGGGLGAEGRF